METLGLNRERLDHDGVLRVSLSSADQLLGYACQLGCVAPSRPNGPLVDDLRPTTTEAARPMSLSAQYGTGAFPFHTDTAHWRIPARYILLHAVRPGRGQRRTRLIDSRSLRFSSGDVELMERAVFTIRSGRNSFLGSIMSRSERFIRFDPGCMFPAAESARRAERGLVSLLRGAAEVLIDWAPGDAVIIDNWRFLHSRADAVIADEDRLLHRVLVMR